MRFLSHALFSFALVLAATCASAQQGLEDVLYLKNGSIIRGEVIEMVPGGSVKIQTADGSLFVFTMAEVERLAKEPFKQPVGEPWPDGRDAVVAIIDVVGYQGMAEIGYGVGMSSNGVDQFKLNFINGYRFNPRLMAGLGLGLRMYMAEDDSYAMVPVFLDARWSILERKTSPYLALGVGITFNGSHDMNTEGMLMSGGMGAEFKLRGRSRLHAGISYDLQKLIVYDLFHSSSGEPLFAERHVDSGAFFLNTGITF